MTTLLLYYLYLNKSWDEMNEIKRFYWLVFGFMGFVSLCQFLMVSAFWMAIFFLLLFIFRLPYLIYFNNTKED
jgi:hypothetical protein